MNSKAYVSTANRRFITLIDTSGEELAATSATKAIEIVSGDEVQFSKKGEDYFVESVLPRRNVLKRQYQAQVKLLASNLDLLLIVAAVHPQVNLNFIDRIASASRTEGIPCALILNKIDLGGDDAGASDIYRRLGIPVLITSALTGQGIDDVRELLRDPELRSAAIAGVSGVGKSTILNRLIPQAEQRTSQVSKRTGQGKQTTTLAVAYAYTREKEEPLYIIDLPGFSSYGVAFMSAVEARESFPEFEPLRSGCQYSDCFHLKEPKCAVKNALETGDISPSRYESYLDILQEIEAARPY